MPASKKAVPARAKAQPKFIKVRADFKRLPAGAKDYVAFVHVASLLMFTASDLGRHSFDAAVKVAQECRVLDQQDWFLPDDMQGQLFLDRGKPYPMVDPIDKGDDGWRWVNRPNPSGSGCAFCVHLNSGGVLWRNRSANGLAVACRRVSPHQALALGIAPSQDPALSDAIVALAKALAEANEALALSALDHADPQRAAAAVKAQRAIRSAMAEA